MEQAGLSAMAKHLAKPMPVDNSEDRPHASLRRCDL